VKPRGKTLKHRAKHRAKNKTGFRYAQFIFRQDLQDFRIYRIFSLKQKIDLPSKAL
jgi:hypothetical protein